MKAIITYLLSGLLFYSGSVQSQCLQNGDFAVTYYGNECGPRPYCWSICTGSIQNWERTHGSPEIFFNSNPLLNVVYMWSSESIGEGIAANYNFIANNEYRIQIRINASSGNSAGKVRLFAANGIPFIPSSSCGNPIPTPQSSQLIVDNPDENLGWKVYEYTYTPNANYNRFWIYPFTSSSTQLDLTVDYVFICSDPCEGIAIYNNGQITSGDTRAGTIYVGSSTGTGGSGTVTVVNNQTTSLIAADEIFLANNLHVNVTSGQFIAKINQPCNPHTLTESDTVREDIDISEFYTNMEDTLESKTVFGEAETEGNSTKSFVYPNPSKGILNINPGVGLQKELATIEVFDGIGRTVFQKKTTLFDARTVTIDLSRFKAGYYFVVISTASFIKTNKVLVQL
jgi:hypothetical protein